MSDQKQNDAAVNKQQRLEVHTYGGIAYVSITGEALQAVIDAAEEECAVKEPTPEHVRR